MGLSLYEYEGQTPLDDDERDGLKIASISTHQELDEFEQLNIEKAIIWSMKLPHKPDLLLTTRFICQLHKRMFGDIWKWAGTFRTSNKNIGTDKWYINTELQALLGDVQYWVSNKTYVPDEIAIRMKHRLVSIHCFANGNGRHSRLMADIIISRIYNRPIFSWGAKSYSSIQERRTTYLKALRLADIHQYNDLIAFARN